MATSYGLMVSDQEPQRTQTPLFLIKYDGGDAERHSVEMRALARSLLGFERTVSDGLILLGEGRAPMKGERHALRVKAREPVIGSSIIPVELTQTVGLLPLGWWFVQTGAGEAVALWLKYVLSHFGGRKQDSEAALEAIVKMREIEGQERLQSQRMWHDQIGALLGRLAKPARSSWCPLGARSTL